MKEVDIELDFGVIEHRIYDNEGKLVEIRKKYPADTTNMHLPAYIKRSPGTAGGHEN